MRILSKLAVKNVFANKLRWCVICILMLAATAISICAYSFSKSIDSMAKKTEEELAVKQKITVVPADRSGMSMALIRSIGGKEGVSSVNPKYNINGLLEEENGTPLYAGSINYFDFDHAKFDEEIDFRGQHVQGVLLPDISYELNGTKQFREYVGNVVRLSFDGYKEGHFDTVTLSCRVIGVFHAQEDPELCGMYVSEDIFAKIAENVPSAMATRATVYVNDVDRINTIAEELSKMGLEVYFESTIKDFLKSLHSFVKSVYAMAALILVLVFVLVLMAARATIKRRMGTIAVMKAYGCSNSNMFWYMALEILVYSVPGVIAGNAVAFLAEHRMTRICGELGNGFCYSTSVSGLLWVDLIVLASIFFVLIVPFISISRVDPIEVLRKRE